MKRITCSVLITLAASALYINSSDSVQADDVVPVPVSDRGRFDAQEATLRLTEEGLHPGDGSGDIHSNAAITRQDFVIMIVKALNLSTAERPEVATFKDVPNDHYAFSAIEGAVHAGLVKGVGNGRFGLGQSLTRQDMAVLYQRALQGITDNENSDGEAKQLELYDGSFSPYAKEAIELAMELGLFQESAAEAWNPKGIVTQEEAALVTAKWLKAVEHISSDAAENEVETPPESAHPVIHGIVTSSSGSTSTTPSVPGTAQSHTGTENLASQPDLPTTAPTAPTDLKFRYEKGQIQLTWTAKQGETYNIYYSEKSGTGYTLLSDGANVKSGSYATSDVRFQETAYYVVEAVNSFGKSGYSNEVSSRPNKISGLQAILNEEDESIGLTWTDVQEGVIYHVYYIGPDGVLYRLNEEPLVSRAYLIPNRNMLVGPSGRYAIHVVAVNELNVSSEPSNEVALEVKKDPEDRITITDPSVALPSEDLEEEEAVEQESTPEEYESQE